MELQKPSTEHMRLWLSEKLGREVTVGKVRVAAKEMYLADYINHSAPALKLASETEDGAIENLFFYLVEMEKTSQTPV